MCETDLDEGYVRSYFRYGNLSYSWKVFSIAMQKQTQVSSIFTSREVWCLLTWLPFGFHSLHTHLNPLHQNWTVLYFHEKLPILKDSFGWVWFGLHTYMGLGIWFHFWFFRNPNNSDSSSENQTQFRSSFRQSKLELVINCILLTSG
jgi:hypothetical protein